MNNPTCDQCDCVAGCRDNPAICPNVEVQPVQTPVSDGEIANTVNALRDIAMEFYGSQQLRERIAYIVVPLLKTAHPKETKWPNQTKL